MNLTELGWNDFFQGQLDATEEEFIPARVARLDGAGYQLLSEGGDLTGTLTGKLRFAATTRADLPCVGDWVLVTALANEPGKAVMHQLLERKSSFSRKEAWVRTEEQVLSANIDTIFIVCGLDKDFNLRRIERYLLLAWDSGATPVIVLSKSDLCTDVDARVAAVESISMGVDIIPVSGVNGDGFDQIPPYLGVGVTVTLLGSSGVGKSTIINRLLGVEHFDTGGTREDDSKGRHTTTFREMAALPGGGLIIDTPGMRELQVWGDEESLSHSFDDVESLAGQCRFGDCAHGDEPGCAVKEALSQGALDEDRFRSYQKLGRELARLARRQNAQMRVAEKNNRKKFSRMVRHTPTKRDLF